MEKSSTVACQTVELRVRDLTLICGSVKNIVSKSFGPMGKQSLLTSGTGQVIVTCDGSSLLSALHFSHPVAKCIMNSILTFHKNYGDGCKTFLIYLHELFQAIERNHSDLDFSDCDDASYRRAVLKYLQEFMNNDFETICSQVKKYIYDVNCRLTVDQPGVFGNVIRNVIKSCFSLPVSELSKEHLTDTVTCFVESINDSLGLKTVLKFFDLNVIVVIGGPYINSHVTDGILLRADIQGEELPQSDVKFIFMQCPVEGNCDKESSDIIAYKKSSHESILNFRSQTAYRFLLAVKNLGVSVILTTERVPDYVVQLCKKLKISVTSCLECNDIEFLSCVSSGLPVSSVYEDLHQHNVVSAQSYEKVFKGGRCFVKLVLQESRSKCIPKSLILSAPTEGLGQQLKLMAKKCMKVVDLLLSESCVTSSTKIVQGRHLNSTDFRENSHLYEQMSDYNNVERVNLHNFHSPANFDAGSRPAKLSPAEMLDKTVAAGGYFENVIIYLLQQYNQKSSLPQIRFCCKAVAKMLEGITKVLFQNSHDATGANQNRTYSSLQQELMAELSENKISGYTIHGKLCNPMEYGAVDVLDLKIAAVYAAVNLATRLLQVDSIVSVQRFPPNNSNEDSSDDNG